ncbi:MAG TPA: helix-turn-helix transcriptional regulator [Archangium sp.]|uniref:helix-turn-helix domain-containing protein n=1 Tax=Archangium sp. TaxID=1872627 RepID=UPI002E332EC9|nr:helix-turn-helix transcriptional regulator [Archangium sp.]HEX5754362.1 helix-turn-helix transcriptional regulator [Archangium sp.]
MMPTALQRHLGKVARDTRLRLGLTQAQMARRASLAPIVYGRIERARMMPSVSTLLRLCGALELDANTLLGFSSREPPSWLTPPEDAADGTPEVRQLRRAIRTLTERQLAALATVARSMVAPPRKRAPRGG